jgi:hypothetical protein
VNKKKRTACAVALTGALVAGCGSKLPVQPACPTPPPLPAWVIEAANGPSLTPDLDKIISPYGNDSPPLKTP